MALTYKAAIIQSDCLDPIVNKPKVHVKSNELLVKVHGCFICGSDLKTLKFGNSRISKDRVMGHEIAGTVVEVDSNVEGFKIGDRVALGADFPCFRCENCSKQDYGACITQMAIGHEYDGGFAEFILVPPSFVKAGPIIKVNEDMPLRLAGLAEPVACCLRSFNKPFVPDRVANLCIFGCGPIGSIIATITKIKLPDAHVIFIDPNAVRRDYLKSLSIGNSWFAHVSELPKKTQPDVIFIACSVPEAQRDGVEIVRNGGTVCMFGGIPMTLNKPVIDSNLVHYKELCVFGTTGSDKLDLSNALKLISSNQDMFNRLISREFPLAQIEKAVKFAQSENELKVLVRCE